MNQVLYHLQKLLTKSFSRSLAENARNGKNKNWEVVEKDLFDLAYTDIDGLDVVVDAY